MPTATTRPRPTTTRFLSLRPLRRRPEAPSPDDAEEPAAIGAMRSPAAYCFGFFGPRRKMRFHQGSGLSVTIRASTRLAPQRRQNLRVGSLGSPQLPQIRSPGWATRCSTVAAGLGRAWTTAVGWREAGWASAGTACGGRAAGCWATTGAAAAAATGGRAAG